MGRPDVEVGGVGETQVPSQKGRMEPWLWCLVSGIKS